MKKSKKNKLDLERLQELLRIGKKYKVEFASTNDYEDFESCYYIKDIMDDAVSFREFLIEVGKEFDFKFVALYGKKKQHMIVKPKDKNEK